MPNITIGSHFSPLITWNSQTPGEYSKGVFFDDLRVAASSVKLTGLKQPTWEKLLDNGSGSTGVYTLAFPHNTETEVFFNVQIPHIYRFGSDFRPHVHWLTDNTGTGTVKWD